MNGSSRDEQSRNAEYLPPGFLGGNQDNKGDLSPYRMSGVARAILNSNYLKAVQQLLDDFQNKKKLLDEVVNVREALKQHDSEKSQSTHEQRMKSSNEGDQVMGDPKCNFKWSRILKQHIKRDLACRKTRIAEQVDKAFVYVG
ncbi:hypothetical protein LWI29_015125 [Acer saccharum]|uniref:Uncharacterized protein n=1 Tax=Acer saccharum TaxID=4024 RepID=A0AA39W2X5_ACESA|nr:hypothetical protein LWI29_015125 [Acer saccharum]